MNGSAAIVGIQQITVTMPLVDMMQPDADEDFRTLSKATLLMPSSCHLKSSSGALQSLCVAHPVMMRGAVSTTPWVSNLL
jgi:L-cysteine desulfidase